MAKRHTSLSSISVQQLHAELRRRQRRATTLQRRRDRLAKRIEAIDEQIRTLGGPAAPTAAPRRRRSSNKVTLTEALQQALKGKTMSVADAAEAVKVAGYKTHSKTFRTQVNIALIKHPKLFRRVGWGKYTAR